MQSIRSILVATAAVVVAGAVFVFAASIGLALAGIASVVMLGSWISTELQPTPLRAKVHAGTGRPGQREPRVWNDGRGTIIDL